MVSIRLLIRLARIDIVSGTPAQAILHKELKEAKSSAFFTVMKEAVPFIRNLAQMFYQF